MPADPVPVADVPAAVPGARPRRDGTGAGTAAGRRPPSGPRVVVATRDPQTVVEVRRALPDGAAVGTAGSLPELWAAVRGAGPDRTVAPAPAAAPAAAPAVAPAAVLCDVDVVRSAPDDVALELHRIAPDTCLLVLGDVDALPQDRREALLAGCFALVERPLRPAALTALIASAVRHHDLLAGQRVLLEGTLPGLVEAFVESLATAHPLAYRRTARMALLVAELARRTGTPLDWRLRLAALVSQLGSFAVPADVLLKIEQLIRLPAVERQLFHGHLALARRLLDGIPQLGEVAEWVGAQPVDPQGLRPTGGDPLTGAAACFDVAAAFLTGYDEGLPAHDIGARLEASGRYTPALVDAVLDAADVLSPKGSPHLLPIEGLTTGMVLAKDVRTVGGILLVRQGELVTSMLTDRLRSFAELVGVAEPLTVFVPQLRQGPAPRR